MAKHRDDHTSKDQPAAGAESRANDKHVCELLDEIHELEQFRRQQLLLRKLSSYVKSSLSTGEALAAVTNYAPQLWPGASGAVYLMNMTSEYLECAASWGGAARAGAPLDWQDCWALRNLRAHCVTQTTDELPCRHLTQPAAAMPSICVPLVAQGQMLGLLHLQQLNQHLRVAAGVQSLEIELALATAVAEDISLTHANVRLRESLREQSIRDALTGLFNRRFVDEFLLRELARAERKTRQLSMIALDIDHFKRINDTFGHGAGDKVLQNVGSILQAHVRDSDVASRVGGEEFLILLSESPLQLAVKRAEDIRNAIHHMALKFEDKDLGCITASFGAVAFPDHGRTPEALIRAADRALYAAKNAGRNQVMSANTPLQ